MARELETLARQGDLAAAWEGASTITSNADDPIYGELARQSYEDRRQRDRVFNDPALFGEPAWDILLDLFVSYRDGRKISTSSACIGAAVPPTTALRWLTVLTERNLIEREDDPHDARRHFVRLTARGYDLMLEYFGWVSRANARQD